MAKDRYEAAHDKRIIKLIAAAVVFTIIVLCGLLWITRTPSVEETGNVKSDIPLIESGRIASESVASDFIKSAGNFGIKESELTGDNIRNVSYLLTSGDASIKKYLTSRKDSYSFLRSNYIYKNSPLDYDSREVAQWKTPTEDRNLTSYEVTDVTAIARDKAQVLTIDGKETTAAEVDVTFNSKMTIRLVTANDTSWDGSYSVLEKSFPKSTVTLLVVQDGESWKVYAQNNLEKQFILSTWSNPDPNSYTDAQTGFTQVSTLNLTVPLKEPTQ